MYVKIRKLNRTVTREISKYKYAAYMKDFPDGTPDGFRELTGKKLSQKEIKAYNKSIKVEEILPEVDGSTDGDEDGAT